MIRILIAHDNTILCQLMQDYLKRNSNYDIVGIVDDVFSLKKFISDNEVDIILLDYSLPVGGGTDFIIWMKKKFPAIKIIAFSVYNDEDIAYAALLAGACGFIAKNNDITLLSKIINAVDNGEVGVCYGVEPNSIHKFKKLTDREKEVLILLSSGYTNRMISDSLLITIKTVEAHRAKIKAKTGINTTTGLIKFAIQEGLISTEI